MSFFRGPGMYHIIVFHNSGFFAFSSFHLLSPSIYLLFSSAFKSSVLWVMPCNHHDANVIIQDLVMGEVDAIQSCLVTDTISICLCILNLLVHFVSALAPTVCPFTVICHLMTGDALTSNPFLTLFLVSLIHYLLMP
jgi:hypothetical protein